MKKFIASAACASFIFGLATSASAGTIEALDMTGSWLVTAKCKGLAFDGTKLKLTLEETVTISQLGSTAAMDASALSSGGGGPRGVTTETMCGTAFLRENQTAQGAASFGPFVDGAVDDNDTTGDADPNGFGAIDLSKVKVFADTGSGVTGTAKGTATLLPGFGAAGACKLKMTRTSDADPGLSVFACFLL